MTFILKINPVQVAHHFAFKCAANTPLQSYQAPPQTRAGTTRISHSLLIPKNAPYYLCMWCARTVTEPIGLPIEHVNEKRIVEQISSNSGEKYTIKEDGDYQPHFKTYGIFCSLGCTKAFWLDNKTKPCFEFCGLYLHQIWTAEFGPGVEFVAAPPRETLKVFGGTLDYSEFHSDEPRKLHVATLFYTAVVTHES